MRYVAIGYVLTLTVCMSLLVALGAFTTSDARVCHTDTVTTVSGAVADYETCVWPNGATRALRLN